VVPLNTIAQEIVDRYADLPEISSFRSRVQSDTMITSKSSLRKQE